MLKSDLTAIDGADYLDFNEDGLDSYDLKTDFFDSLHFDPSGAEKFSKALAGRISQLYALPATEGADEELWSYRSYCFRNMAGLVE